MVDTCGVETTLVLCKSEDDFLYDGSDVKVQQALRFQAQESFAERVGSMRTPSADIPSKRFV
jgi:hypothetical protein